MTQEDKELLLKDLCARLPYGVKCDRLGHPLKLVGIHTNKEFALKFDRGEYMPTEYTVDDVKPYLRPMSSMTDEEKKEMSDGSSLAFEPALNGISGYCPETMAYNTFNVDFCLAHHLDFRGLIEKGLAIEAPDGMYGEKHEKPEEPKRIPATIEEALDILDDVLTEEDKEYLVENGAISAHFSLGMWIRNEWKLWEPVDSDIKTYLKKEGYEHPDDMSNYIIEEFIKYLNNKL